ncbi:MAR-binding filament-like protein 1-1 isoform X2 [Rhododendron vialii]|nr:MAR-binding filament-like protein 1-1 isoform X2 [Rhododendron vialii]
MADQKQKPKQILQGDASPNSFLSLLNGFGIFSSVLLGALYVLTRKEQIATEAIIESLISKLNKKEVIIDSLEKNFESKLLNENEEQDKQLKEANEEQQSLMNQLKSAKNIATRRELELQNEKRLVEDLSFQIESIRTQHTKAKEGKKELEDKLEKKINSIEVLQKRITLLSAEITNKEDTLHDLHSTLSAKESDLKRLNSTYEQTKDELAGANSEITRLKQEFLRNEKELELMNGVVDGLNAQIRSLTEQKEDSIRKFDAIRTEYDDLKSSSEEKAAANVKLLGERDCDLHQLKEKIDIALTELSRNQVLIPDLTQEREDLRKMLDIELKQVENLKSEPQLTRENLGKSRDEVSDMQEQLNQSRSLCLDLELEISKVKVEFSKAAELFHLKFDEAKCSSEVLAAELKSANDVLKKKKDELRIASLELAAAAENNDILRKELVDVYKKAESATHDLNEERKVVTSLNKELKDLVSSKESRKSLEMDLEEATKSLDEMNLNALLISRELEMSKSQISSLEDEKHVMYNSLVEQKQFSQEARENMEDAHSLIMKLGMERENFGNRAKKLEEELALAKGEILRLRSQINSSRAPVNDWHLQKDEGGSNAPLRSEINSSRAPVNDRHHQKDEGGSNVPLRRQINSSRAPVNDRHHQKDEGGGSNAPFSRKKFSRRRKGNPQRDNS